MPNNASRFIKNRGISITYNRINHILWYVSECYLLLKQTKPSYSKSWVKEKTTHHFEDYLKAEFVDRYLIPNKALLSKRTSDLEQINFTYETQKRYIDIEDGKDKPDKIDIYINKLGLQKEWNTEDEHIYFAIECKRITVNSDYKMYITDIEKFVNREYSKLRLPYEGQIAFIENSSLDHVNASIEINSSLKKADTITTTQYLGSAKIHDNFPGSYSSTHKRNHGDRADFSVFHLLFDYSDIVVE